MIDRLFRQVDADNNHFVDVDELYQLLKPLRPGKISKPECSQIIKRFTINNSGHLDQEEFHRVVKAEIQGNLTKQLTDIENHKKTFRLQDKDKDSKLTHAEFKNTISTKLGASSIDDDDLNALISFLDQDGDGLIEIDEFFVTLQHSGSLDFAPGNNLANSEQNEKNKKIQRCLLEIRNTMSFDLFEYFAFFGEHALPGFFAPSFLQPLLENEYRNMPAKGLVTETPSAVARKTPDFSSADRPDSEIKIVEKTCLEICI